LRIIIACENLFERILKSKGLYGERVDIAVGCGSFYMCQHVEGIKEMLVPDRVKTDDRDG